MKIVVQKEKLLVPFANLDDVCKQRADVTQDNSKDKQVEENIIPSSSTLNEEVPYATKQPKVLTEALQSTKNIQQKIKLKPNTKQRKIWVPKGLIAAQGNVKQIWIPKCSHTINQPRPAPVQTKSLSWTPSTTSQSTWRWVPKQVLQALKNNSKKWIPKTNQPNRRGGSVQRCKPSSI